MVVHGGDEVRCQLFEDHKTVINPLVILMHSTFYAVPCSPHSMGESAIVHLRVAVHALSLNS